MKYQDFVSEHFSLCCYSSRENQIEKGENTLGMEIKYDQRLSETGNIYIEVAEKSNKDNESYVGSGILTGNSWLYLIGNYEVAYVFSVKTLKHIHTNKLFYKQVETPTSQGFLITKEQADKWNINKIYFTA